MKIRVLLIISMLANARIAHCQQKKVFLTGGAGFIGSHVAQALIKRGDRVVIIDDMNDYYDVALKHHNLTLVAEQASGGHMSFYKVDICDAAALRKIYHEHKPDIICHLAARAGVRASILEPELYCRSNILGTLNLLELAKEHGIKNFVLASSSSVYGMARPQPFVEEKDTNHPVSPYAATKRACELLAYTYHSLYHIPISCLRFFTVYGPRGRPDMAPFKFLDAVHHARPIMQYGDGSAIRDFTYIDDIVDGVVSSIDHVFDFEIFNLGRGEPVVLKDFINVIEKVTGKQPHIIQVDPVEGDVHFTHANIDKAHRMLGYSPKISIEEGMRRFYTWYKNEYLRLHGK